MSVESIKKTYSFPDFLTGLDFVNRIAAVAETQAHHPDIVLKWGKVEVTSYTHSVNGLTEKDTVLMAAVDELYQTIQEKQQMLGVGQKFPEFNVTATVSLDMKNAFTQITNESFANKWKVYFFWPKDFTFVCPTEIAAFGKLNGDFLDRDAQLLGGSTDSEFVHHAWRTHHADLKDLPFPMLADVKQELCKALGILDPNAGVAQRATFVVDPEGVIRFVSVNDLSVGRNPQEVLRVLDALQTDELCPCNWNKGDDVLKV
jgi:lipoyl-dependent peroxiredoxin subunit C